ncbi:MAG: hypothetical protein SFY66_24065 [Oculatellaceae cyanobacterium bins.114]|nr:hypothetical protein [Oculatellaceae cyanobacterium bins.114]
MSLKQARYEELLAEYSNHLGAIALLKQHRPYLEMIPSMRRPSESVIPIPLPIIRVRSAISSIGSGGSAVESGEVLRLPCDVSILMCDPEWKIKTGVEIFVFIYRAQEDFSDLLGRWRQTQIWLDKGYEWLMPLRYQHILSEGADHTHPLFVVFPDTPDRIKRGLRGACLPFVTQHVHMLEEEDDSAESLPPKALEAED